MKKKLVRSLLTVVRLRTLVILILLFWPLAGQTQPPVKIGVIGALSGPKAPYGESQLRGVQLAVEEINQSDRLSGTPLQIIPADDRGDMGLVGTLVSDLVFKDQVLALLGSVDSGCTHVVSMVAVKTHVPHFTCVATDPSITRAGSPWTFRTLADDERQSEALVTYLQQKKGIKRIGVIAADSRYGRMGATILARNAVKAGMKVNGPHWMGSSDESMEKAVRAVLAEPIEALIVWSLADEGKKAVERINGASFKGLILGGDGLATPAFFSSDAPGIDGIIVTCPYVDANPSLINQAFKKSFQKKFGMLPDSFAAHAYDTMYLLAKALSQSRHSRQELRAAISRIGPFEGATGLIHLDASGNDTRPVMLAICEQRSLRPLDTAP